MIYSTPRHFIKALLALFALSLAVFILSPTACIGPPDEDIKVVIISLDGMADWLLDYLLENDLAPNIKRVIDNGAAAEHAYTVMPAKTAISHASLWTGTDPSHNGIHSNSVIPDPYSDNTLNDMISGYDADGLQAEPIWSSAARQGKKTVVVQATQGIPYSYYFGDSARFPTDENNLLLFDGYYQRLLAAGFVNAETGLKEATDWNNLPEHPGEAKYFSRQIGDRSLFFLFFDDQNDPVDGYDTLWICREYGDTDPLSELKPHPAELDSPHSFSEGIDITVDSISTKVYFRLFSLSPDGASFDLFRSQAHHLQSSDPDKAEELLTRAGGFVGNAGWGTFLRGDFGPTIYEGGDGTPEAAYVESVKQSLSCFKAHMTYSIKQNDFDLLIGYISYPDGPNHAWLGYIAEPVGSVNHPLGSKMWPYLQSVYTAIDDYVGAVYDAMPADAVLIVVSDHGFAATDKYFNTNVALKKAGLLFSDEEGNIDLQQTKAVMFRGGSDFVMINSKRFKGGIVTDDEYDSVLQQITQALMDVRDSEGNPVVEKVFRPADDEELAMSGPFAGDLYYKLAPGYYNGSDARGNDIITRMRFSVGNHYGDPRWRPMNSIFLLGGKRGKMDIDLDVVRSIDVAPIASALLGIAPPKNATGKKIPELVVAVKSQK